MDDSIFCTACGKYSAPGSKFCMNCGAALAAHTPAPKKNPWALSLVFGLVAFAGGIVWLVRQPKPANALAISQAIQSAENTSPCGISDIAIDKLRGTINDEGFARVTGRVVNNCASAVGVELKITFYGKDGEILKVEDGFWPASIHNIPAHHEYTFEDLDNVDGFKSYTVEVVGLNVW